MPNSNSNTLDKNKFRLYFSLQKSFNKDMDEMIKDVKISKDIPSFLKDLDLDRGIYSYGVASTDEIDTEGERVIIADDLINGLIKPPYNKIFMSHDHEDIASGVIKFAGRIPDMNNDFYIVERINEAHPMFKNIIGSMANGNLDSYSVSGNAPREVGSNGEMIRRVIDLKEVSRTSYPGNASSGIQGMFFVKTKQGGYSFNKNLEVKQMNEEELKSFVTEAIQKALTPIAEKIGALEVFKKDLEDKKVEDDPKDPSEEGTEGSVKDKEKSETPKEESEEQPSKEEIQKMIDTGVKDGIQKQKDELKPRKSAVKVEEPFKKSKQDDGAISSFLKSGRKDLYDGGAK